MQLNTTKEETENMEKRIEQIEARLRQIETITDVSDEENPTVIYQAF